MSFFPRALTAPVPAPGLAITWEDTGCLLCGGREWSGLVEAPDPSAGSKGLWFAVVQCHECGLCFTNPRPDSASIAQFYPADGYPPYHPRRHQRPGWLRHWWRPQARRDGQAVAWHGQGRLLDFGCGAGSFLRRMGQMGWQVTGLDMSATTVCRVRADLGLRVLVGTLPHPELEPESFDVITMWHSLEHVHQPREVLREAHRLLAPGGKLLVAVPNIDSLPFRWFGPDWYGLDLPRHLTHFTPLTLGMMLERSGFRVTAMEMIRHPNWLSASARRALGRRRLPYWNRWLTTKPAARAVTWYSSLTRQADCLLATAMK